MGDHVSFVELMQTAAAVYAGEVVDGAARGKMLFVIVVGHWLSTVSAGLLLTGEDDCLDFLSSQWINWPVNSSRRVSAAWALSS